MYSARSVFLHSVKSCSSDSCCYVSILITEINIQVSNLVLVI